MAITGHVTAITGHVMAITEACDVHYRGIGLPLQGACDSQYRGIDGHYRGIDGHYLFDHRVGRYLHLPAEKRTTRGQVTSARNGRLFVVDDGWRL